MPSPAELAFDVVAWIVIHLSIGFSCSRIPDSWFDPHSRVYRTRRLEQGGELYQRFFRVRAWKHLLPNGGAIYPDYFPLKPIASHEPAYLQRWLRESCRAEFCHWMMIPPGLLFFAWSSFHFGVWMVLYAILNNVFPIVLQRFNRPRVKGLLSRVEAEPIRREVGRAAVQVVGG